MLLVRSFFIFSLSRIYVLRTYQVVINLIFGGKNYENSNLWAGFSLVDGPNISTVLALSFILFRFLALYRPGLRDWGTVYGTQTGFSNIHSNLLLQNLKTIDISSSLSCNPSTVRLK